MLTIVSGFIIVCSMTLVFLGGNLWKYLNY